MCELITRSCGASRPVIGNKVLTFEHDKILLARRHADAFRE